MNQNFDAIILGAGAAGLFCAMQAAERGRRILLLERAARIGKKILISGGGRCNFTNVHCHPENFLSANPHFAKSALARYTPADFIGLVEKHRIPYHEKTLGQLFCDGSAAEIVHMLENECQAAGVQIILNAEIQEVSHTSEFLVRTVAEEFRAPALVVATGGLSIPKMGATDLGYRLAQQFDIKIQPTRPGLVPLVFSAADRTAYCQLAGVSADVQATAGGHSFREAMLLTHRGISGPAILQISSYWDHHSEISMDLAPGHDLTAPLRASTSRNLAAATAAFQSFLPKRFAARWLEVNAPAPRQDSSPNVPERPFSAWNNQALAELERRAHDWKIIPAGTEGYEKAEVTAGGIDTSELSSKTMESKKISGLFFIGEVVDVTGHLGGFNFQWAWSSAFAAAQAL